jgi:adenylate cyclase
MDNGKRTGPLPGRVTAEIEAREVAAERLIGWVQLGLVVFFGLLYAISPRAEGGSGTTFVPVTLAAYFLFTVVRLVLSYRITLPDWYLVASIVVDLLLLSGLIYSFHIQYAQPPAFYLKAPTLLYMFFFISLRALRFDPRFVLISGIVGALSWAALFAYAVLSDMGEMAVTRNYVEYLTSNSVLIGAEIDKILTIVGVTAILTLALYRGRRLLFDAVQGQAAADDLTRFFAPEVARSITGGADLPAVGQGVLREAAILFVDVRGFTATAERLKPDVMLRLLARYQEVALGVIEAKGGVVDKFLGDGILATFNAVRPSDTFAADALSAAILVIETIEAAGPEMRALGWPGDFRIGAAVASGSVTLGVIGTGTRLEFTVIGSAVNTAAKLESATKALGVRVLTDAGTLRLAMSQGFDGTAHRRFHRAEVIGLARPVDLVALA